MSQSVGGLNKAKVGGFRGAEGTQPPPGTGDLAGKKVTAGDVFKTIGRVALGLVTLGVSELVIRLVQRAQRQPPEVVPTKGPGKAAQTLAPASAPPKGNDGSGGVPTGDTLARSTGPSATGRGGATARPQLDEAEASRRQKQKDDLLKALGPQTYGMYLGAAKSAMQASVRAGKIEFEMFHTLSDAEQVALYAYTSFEYHALNEALRGDGEMKPRQAALCAALDSACEKLPRYEGPVHRGANLFRPEDQARYAPGQTVAEPCFTSTSRSTAKAFDGNTQWAMESKGGRDISFISRSPEEQEILFPRNARFQVLDSRQVGRETHVVMKEV